MTKETLLKAFTLKRLVVGRGHDGGGLLADVYFNKKKVAEYSDDGWGGEADVRFVTNEAEDNIRTYFKLNNVNEIVFNNGYEFMKKLDRIHFQIQICFVVEEVATKMENDKYYRKLENYKKKCFVIGTPDNYSVVKWKGVKNLIEFSKLRGATAALQRAYDNYKSEGILNSKEQLEEMGIKV